MASFGHIGSWGLPDFGLTERVSDFFGQGRTAQGGSNLRGDQSQTTLVPSGTNAKGQPQFAPSGQSGAYGLHYGGTPTRSGSNGDVLGTTSSQSVNNPQQGVQGASTNPFDEEQARRNLINEVDSVYGDVYGNLDQQERDLRAGEQNLYDSFTGQFDAQRPLLEQGYNVGLQQNTQQQEFERQQKENALTAARRLYNELSQGVRQRFGGVNSAGDFANAFFGREFQRNIGNVENQSGQNISRLLDKKQEIETGYQAQLQTLEREKQTALLQAKDVFSQRLAAINNARLGANQNKAELKLQALQDLRANIQNIQQNALNVQNQLRAGIANAQSELASAIQGFNVQAGRAVDTDAIARPFYSQFGRNLQMPQVDLNSIYGIMGRRDDERRA